CASGSVCSDGACVILCVDDLDCAAGRVCADLVCVEGTRQPPVIGAVDGVGSERCQDTGRRCIGSALRVTGERLAGGAWTLRGGAATPVELEVTSGDAAEVVLALPADVAAGRYTLRVSNGAGSAEQEVDLLQGEPG